jgi:DNA polymerase III alpha subunit
LPNTNSSNLELHDYDKLNQDNWFLPEEYRNFDIETYLLNRCKTNAETERVNNELYIYKQKDLLMLLKYIYYLISIMKRNQIVWGVGRGSSVASFILYLIGLNKINPLKYNLDFREFLK